jgi:uncharacterized protein DUF2505
METRANPVTGNDRPLDRTGAPATGARHRGPPLIVPAVAHVALTIAGVAATTIIAGDHFPDPFQTPALSQAFFAAHGDAVIVGAFCQVGAAIPLAVLVASIFSRLRFLGVDVAAPAPAALADVERRRDRRRRRALGLQPARLSGGLPAAGRPLRRDDLADRGEPRAPGDPDAGRAGGARRGLEAQLAVSAETCFIRRMSLSHTVTFHYERPPEELLRHLLDPEYITARSRAMGELDIKVTARREGSRVILVNERDVQRELPSFARKLFSPVNHVTQTETWETGGAVTTGSYDLEVRGAPVKLHATFELRPSAGGTDYRITFEVTVRIPLIGGKLESFTLDQTKAGLQKELEYNAQQLARAA